ncbi:hypothetical protein WYO_3715 [Methylobacterium sp. GXF4]|uniref:hypothetical protein n=1 Tax=Methylobacterium sp. GXF4 TaxID=1096546 RepID=UPI0002698033|nr:hypothetical protein [Methylobacterium sp. GXF4]EIZ83702.1 hypothetical protein WYO_3715 [Methylobacterium sp. GXF4]
MFRLRSLALVAALALAPPAFALDAIQSTTVPGRAPTALCTSSPAGIAINRADGTLSFCDPSAGVQTAPLPQIDTSGNVRLRGGPRFGSYQNGKFTSQPDAVETGSVLSSGVSSLDTTFAGTVNPNALMLRPGNSVSFCPLLSCIQGPTGGASNSAFWDHQRATLLISAQTRDDAHSEEQTLATITTVGTKQIKPYASSTAYALGDNIAIGNAVYRATAAGTTGTASAPPGTRPASAPFTATDGSVTWTWINDASISGSLGHYNEVTAIPGAGSVWAGVDNLQLQPGVIPSFNVGREIDLTNNSGSDCAIGVANCKGLYVAINGTNKSTTGIAVSSSNTANFASLWGIQVAGNKLASEADIDVEGGAKVGLGFNTAGIGAGAHSEATIRDRSTSPTSIDIGGSHTAAITTNNAATGYALVAGSGQKVCLNALDDCWAYSGTAGAAQFLKGGNPVFSVTDAGDISQKGHVGSTGATVTVSSCGTSPTVKAGSNDNYGTIVEGTSATGCNINFAVARATAPHCIVSPNNGTGTTLVVTSTTALSWTNTSASNLGFTYACYGT